MAGGPLPSHQGMEGRPCGGAHSMPHAPCPTHAPRHLPQFGFARRVTLPKEPGVSGGSSQGSGDPPAASASQAAPLATDDTPLALGQVNAWGGWHSHGSRGVLISTRLACAMCHAFLAGAPCRHPPSRLTSPGPAACPRAAGRPAGTGCGAAGVHALGPRLQRPLAAHRRRIDPGGRPGFVGMHAARRRSCPECHGRCSVAQGWAGGRRPALAPTACCPHRSPAADPGCSPSLSPQRLLGEVFVWGIDEFRWVLGVQGTQHEPVACMPSPMGPLAWHG